MRGEQNRPAFRGRGSTWWILAALAAAGPARASGPLDWKGLAWPVDGDLSNSTALARVLPLPTGDGNACAELARLTALEDQKPPFPDLGVYLTTRQEGSNADKAKLRKLAADPEITSRLKAFRAAAKMGRCQTMGTIIPWPDGGNPAHWRVLRFAPILAHAAVADQLAWDLAEKGDLAGAEAWLQALVYSGWVLQQDVLLIANLVGITLGKSAANSLAEIIEAKSGAARAGEAERWRAYSGRTQWNRYAAWTDLLKPLVGSGGPLEDDSLHKLAAIAAEPRMMRGARAEAILALGTAHLRRKGGPEPSPLQKTLFAQIAKPDDPVLAGVAKVFGRYLALPAPERAKLSDDMSKLATEEAGK